MEVFLMGGFGDILKVVGALGALGATIFFSVKIMLQCIWIESLR